MEVERVKVVLVGVVDVVEAAVAQGVGSFFPVWVVWPFAVFGDGDGAVVELDGVLGVLHVVVVDEEVAAEIAGQADVVRVDAEDDVDDSAAVGGVLVELDKDHERGLVPYPSTHGWPG